MKITDTKPNFFFPMTGSFMSYFQAREPILHRNCVTKFSLNE